MDDPDDTIDAQVAPAHSAPANHTLAQDYSELREVDRQHYVIEREIATGGMGRVLAARDRRLGREIAIKELLPKHRYAVRRFEREARVTARLQHPAIIHVYEAGTWPGGEPFYAMPKIANGRSLDQVVATCKTLEDRLGLVPNVIAVSDALAYAHSQRVIHRDLKPSNVLIGDFGETVVIDWGLAKDFGAGGDAGESMELAAQGSPDETTAGTVVGTPAYMPPEQARGENVDQRADVYALGALLYKVLAGRAPYTGKSSQDVLEQVTKGPPRAVGECEPAAPRELVAIVAKAMAREPAQRYASAGEVATELKRFQKGQLVAAHRYTPVQLIARWVRRHLLAISVSMIALVAIAVVAIVSVRRIVAEKARAEARRFALLEEHAYNEKLDGNSGRALAYLAALPEDGHRDGLRAELIAAAKQSFDLERLAPLPFGPVLAVSADGKRIAAGGGNRVMVSDVEGHREPGPALPARSQVLALAWDASGTRLAGGGAGAWVWTRGGGLVVIDSGAMEIEDIAFDPTGDRVVTAAKNAPSVVWNAKTGERIATDSCGAAASETARFSAAGDRIVTANGDGTACVWTAATGAVIRIAQGHAGPLEMAIWAHDDQWIVTASDDGTARVWDAEMGKPVMPPLHHEDGSVVRVVALSHDGRRLLTAGSDRLARIWDLPDSASFQVPHPRVLAGQTGEIVSAMFSNDDAHVATGGLDRRAMIWDADSGVPLTSLEHDDEVVDVAFAGEALVTSSRDGRTTIWDPSADLEHYELDSQIHAIAASSTGVIAVATDDSHVTLIEPGAQTVLRGHQGRVFAVAFSPDGKTLVSAGEDRRPLVWDVATHRHIADLGAHDRPILALAVAHDGRIATASGDTVRVFAPDGTLLATLTDAAAAITAIAFAPGDQAVIAGTDDGAIVEWFVTSGAQPVLIHKLRKAIRSLAYGPDGSLVAAAASVVAIFPLIGATVTLDNPGVVNAAQFAGDGSLVITAGEDGAKIWDASTGRLVDKHGAEGHSALALALGRGKAWLARDKGGITTWRIAFYEQPLAELQQYVREHDSWYLDDGDVLQRRQESDEQRGTNRE